MSFLDSALSESELPYRVASEGLLIGDGNAGALWQMPDIVGNSPLETRVFRSMAKDLPELTYWRLWAVRYIVTERSLDHPAVDRLFELDGRQVYELKQEWRNEPAWFADRVNFAPSDRKGDRHSQGERPEASRRHPRAGRAAGPTSRELGGHLVAGERQRAEIFWSIPTSIAGLS